MNIGLTGGIACGKSTVSKMLVDKGAILVDADAIAREVVMPGEPGWKSVIHRFGEEIVLPDHTLDRKKLGEIVFSDKQARIDLQEVLHPLIRARMKQQMDAGEKSHPKQLVVVDVPLLYESRLESQFKAVVVVYVDRETQIRRLIQRDSITLRQAEHRLNAQMSIEEKKERADYVIDNRGTLEDTKKQIDALWKKIHVDPFPCDQENQR
jgi:dephospho-CoA kinase